MLTTNVLNCRLIVQVKTKVTSYFRISKFICFSILEFLLRVDRDVLPQKHWQLQMQEFLPGGSRPACQKTALTTFVLVFNLFYCLQRVSNGCFKEKL